MKAVVLLFTKKNAGDSEEIVFPELTRVTVTVEGNPNDIYSRLFFSDLQPVSGSARKLVGMQSGILIEIEKETTTTDLSCHVFVVADRIINIMVNKLQGTHFRFLRKSCPRTASLRVRCSTVDPERR